MKKVLSLIAALVLVVSLTGCGEAEKVTVCKGSSNGVQILNTITYEGKKVNSLVYENTIEVDEAYKDTIQQALEDYNKKVSSYEGISYSYTFTGNVVTERIEIDCDVVDMDALIQLEMATSIDGKTPTFIEYEATLKNMTDLGLTCTEQE